MVSLGAPISSGGSSRKFLPVRNEAPLRVISDTITIMSENEDEGIQNCYICASQTHSKLARATVPGNNAD